MVVNGVRWRSDGGDRQQWAEELPAVWRVRAMGQQLLDGHPVV